MAQTENQKKLIKILNEMFQLDRSDLDFGIYRIMNTKAQEINEFLENDLLSSVANAFSKSENEAEQNELDELEAKDTVSGYINGDESTKKVFENLEDVKRYILLNEKLSKTTTSLTLENNVFSHLATFFKRYYKDGDFVSLRRYKKDIYAIPYEGEEVKLHWANSDQYYIKSGEYFRDYTFKIKGKYAGDKEKIIHLKLSDAETQSDNNKAEEGKERRFVILENNPCEVIGNELYINFEYKSIEKNNQVALNEKAIDKVLNKVLEDVKASEFVTALKELAPTEKNKDRTIFEKHLKNYTSRNSFDYFIHKDLGGFLNRELDFYIKNEILFLDDIMDSPIKYDEVMGKVKIFKEISQKIINFLTQLEELQKKLWEKKKFVIETNYCITLDKINEKYYDEVFKNKKQLAEWQELFNLVVQSVDDLKEEKYLVLDTKFFDIEFKYKLLSKFDNLDENIDGVLINSENFGALNLLQDRYREQVKTVYIDPPYNTGNDGFLYNDNYQHSSWMSFMYDRLALGRELMSDDGVIFSSIGDEEYNTLKNIQNLIFNENNKVGELSVTRAEGGGLAKFLIKGHDYVLMYSKLIDNFSSLLRPKDIRGKIVKKYGIDFWIETDWLRKEFGKYGNCHYEEIEVIKGINKKIEVDKELEAGNYVLVPQKNKMNLVGRLRNIKEDGTKFYSVVKHLSAKGVEEVRNMFSDVVFAYPKPLSLLQFLILGSTFFEKDKKSTILDYFAGSGTTGHAVINLNREDNGKRKYILVEMGEYFNSVTKPRIQKVIYSDNWKDGKPTTKKGISQIFKYLKLESYEDTLNNLEFKKPEERKKILDSYPQVKEDYILNYSLDVESKGSLLNIDTFKTPFDYKLKIATSCVGETKDTAIDLVETFNYLLGLVVKRMEMIKGYVVVEGANLKNEKILIIWRDNKSNDQLNEFMKNISLENFDNIYVNGDNNLEKVKLIEKEFKKLMFGA